MAFGVSRRSRSSYSLEVRLENREMASHPAVEEVLAQAPGEVNIRLTGQIRALIGECDDGRLRHRPVRIGCSVGHPLVTAGTVGCFIRPKEDSQKLCLLSNNHILAATDKASLGDPILQPGKRDSGRPEDRIAGLSHIVPLKRNADNRLDIAAAALDPGIEITGNEIPGGVLKGAEEPTFDDPVVTKIGRTTGQTHGVLKATELALLNVVYGVGRISFTDVIEFSGDTQMPFSAGGDSGSVVYSSTRFIGYGVIFAGADGGGIDGHRSYACPLPLALEAVDAELAT
jgi:hypothetical protein